MQTNDLVAEGVRLARELSYEDALKIFDQDLCFTQNPIAMSYYALCLAHIEGNYERAISLCLMAAEKEFYNPDIYLNLGRIFLLNGQKGVAVKAFKKGLRLDDRHQGILNEVTRLGIRRRPVLTFLHRGNPVNKFLGMVTGRIY
ncbi:MAG: hypothetical protein HY887_03625 [Deltaproteobacteria bacterium]|nr:hypothetical protein [Deltaproteobacteria bacterium]